MAARLPPATGLFERPPFGNEIAHLRALHPRATWRGHIHLGPLARFWLQRHAAFRTLAAALAQGADGLREGHVDSGGFLPWFAPRCETFLRELHGHHTVEDLHLFPLLRAADRRLDRGFDILDADHHEIDRLLHDLAQAHAGLCEAFAGRGEPASAGALLSERLQRTLVGLGRHLDDEEDLVIPLILERSEEDLGVT